MVICNRVVSWIWVSDKWIQWGWGQDLLKKGAFLPKPPPIFNHYRVHELGLWYPILELFLCQTLDFEIYIQD